MLLTALRRRDPNLIALRRAIRVAVAVPLTIFLLSNIPATAPTALYGVFACLALLLFGNFAGTWQLRGAAYLTTTAVGGLVDVVANAAGGDAGAAYNALFRLTGRADLGRDAEGEPAPDGDERGDRRRGGGRGREDLDGRAAPAA